MSVKTRKKKENSEQEKHRERCRYKLQKHFKKYKKKVNFANAVEKEIWKSSARSANRSLAYVRSCRRVLKNYRGQQLRARTVATRSTLAWLNATERKRWKNLRKEIIEEKQADLLKFSEDKSLLQCGRCKEFKVSYYQRQTRSADEPMSVFATCHACGKKWKQ